MKTELNSHAFTLCARDVGKRQGGGVGASKAEHRFYRRREIAILLCSYPSLCTSTCGTLRKC